jgi:hypothetical protein
VIGASATIFGASLGLALTAAVSLIATNLLFYRVLGKKNEICDAALANDLESKP